MASDSTARTEENSAAMIAVSLRRSRKARKGGERGEGRGKRGEQEEVEVSVEDYGWLEHILSINQNPTMPVCVFQHSIRTAVIRRPPATAPGQCIPSVPLCIPRSLDSGLSSFLQGYLQKGEEDVWIGAGQRCRRALVFGVSGPEK